MSAHDLPHCQTSRTRNLNETNDLGHAVFRYGRYQRRFNKRTGSPFNHLQFPTDIVFQGCAVPAAYKLSLRDLAEMFLPARVRIYARSGTGVGRALRMVAYRAPALQTEGRELVRRLDVLKVQGNG
jgi:hypothetical protein